MTPLFSRLPADGPLTGRFGQTEGYDHPHRGVDIGVPVGTPVINPCLGDAKVQAVHTITVPPVWGDNSFGNCVVVDVLNTPWYYIVAHLSRIDVKDDQPLKPGDQLGLSGQSGADTRGASLGYAPHVHWQVCKSAGFPADISQSTDPLDLCTFTPTSGGEQLSFVIPQEDWENLLLAVFSGGEDHDDKKVLFSREKRLENARYRLKQVADGKTTSVQSAALSALGVATKHQHKTSQQTIVTGEVMF